MSEANNSHNHQFGSFKEFYPFYLAEHGNVVSRRLHFIGTALVLTLLTYIITFGLWTLLLAVPVVGYGFAWIGHFFFEKNKPATFKFPFYSLLGDFVMFFDILRGRVSILK
ncbi:MULTISPECIES: DUF962 domain-containing protein [unclassified Pseudovibrio]|uniref:DUF962 domain-containing protein n=1 Tax=unclassified Pseudovibrio TaxID=2627060 RepID=UPI0007AE7154|nr:MULTISPECIES: DUF962 domain-containing protein [unclassified Pseudovibrio]KZL22375.1 hypothetical protein PsWM33_03973 [Pseudovibrio sp. WM33]KZL24006.1 hypothetical protein PsAD37_02853 [Pseudovibrio sp. Ad37]